MGEDKGKIIYHQKAQNIHEADLLSQFCEQTFISCQHGYEQTQQDQYPCLPDCFIGMGPYGGLLSAFRKFKDVAWLAIACDLPFLDHQSLSQLINSRDITKLATCFYDKSSDSCEPLITIWEPKAYPILLNYLSLGITSLRKVLTHEDVHSIIPQDQRALININSKEDWANHNNKL